MNIYSSVRIHLCLDLSFLVMRDCGCWFISNCKNVFQSGCSISHSHQQGYGDSSCSASLPIIGMVSLCNYSHSICISLTNAAPQSCAFYKIFLFVFYKIFLSFIFGCAGSQLQHQGSLWWGEGCSLDVVHGLSCPAACGILDTGIEPVPPALESRFLPTGPPGKFQSGTFLFFSGRAGIFFGEVSVEVLCPFLYWVVFLLLVLKVKKKTHILNGLFYVSTCLSQGRPRQLVRHYFWVWL